MATIQSSSRTLLWDLSQAEDILTASQGALLAQPGYGACSACIHLRISTQAQSAYSSVPCTLILPSWDPDATISESREIARAMTALSCIMKRSSAWYCRSFFNRPVRKSHTCIPAHVSLQDCLNAPDEVQRDLTQLCPSCSATPLTNAGSRGSAVQEMSACDKACRQRKAGASMYAEAYLHKAVHAAGDEVLTIWRESGNLWVYLPSKFDGTVQLHAILCSSEWVHDGRNTGKDMFLQGRSASSK